MAANERRSVSAWYATELARGSCMKGFEFGRYVPQKAHLDAVRDATTVRPDPRLVWVEGDPDLTCPVSGLVAGHLAIVKTPSVASHERAAVTDPVANWL